MCKYIKYIGLVCCLASIYSGDAMAIMDSCTRQGYTAGTRCDLQGSTNQGTINYDALCRGTNANCKIRQCYSSCVCEDITAISGFDCCFEESKNYNSTWSSRPYYLMATRKWTNNNGQDATCSQSYEYMYVCKRGYYGRPTSDSNGQCQPCPNNGISHAPDADHPDMAYNDIKNFDVTDCYIENGEDESGIYEFDGQCYYK